MTPKQAQRRAWGLALGLSPAWYLLPRLWLDHATWREEIGDLSGYCSILWIGLIVLIPSLVRFGGSFFSPLLIIRKPLGVGCGVFILTHGLFTTLVPAGGNPTVLVTGGNAAGIQNFVAAGFLVLFSFRSSQRLLPARWRREHRRWLTLFILFSGALSTLDSERTVLPVLVRSWAVLCFGARGLQLVLDRSKIRIERLPVNLSWFFFPFSFSAFAHWTERADLLALVYGPLAAVLLARGIVNQLRGRDKDLAQS